MEVEIWNLVGLPEEKRAIGSKSVYKVKTRADGLIKTSSSESRGQEEAESMRVFRPMRPLQLDIYTDGRSKFLKCCSSAAITAIA